MEIEENTINFLISFWFTAPIAPIIVVITINNDVKIKLEYIIMIRGLIFCQAMVIKILKDDKFSTTWGSQKCTGGTPIFTIRAIITILFFKVIIDIA